jgi:holo-[acyl-carrier protein] synthase
MIYGIGIDLIEIRRVKAVLGRWGARFVSRVFTRDETALCYKRPSPASAFALRFAAKEAFSKALGTGMRQGIRWRDIEVFHFEGGRPGLRLHGRALTLCREEGISGLHLSMSDERDYGVAMVVLERADNPETSR